MTQTQRIQIVKTRWIIWSLLTLPAIPMTIRLLTGAEPGEPPVTESLLHPTGEFAGRFMIIAMMASPLMLLFPKSKFVAGMVKYRRDLGVAAFAYAAAHTILYIADRTTLVAMLDEFWEHGIWTGWLAFLVFVPLAATSNQWSTIKLGKAWKTLQRFVYLAAVATLLHWIFIHNELGPALVHFVPLALLEGYRIWHVMTSQQNKSAAASG